MTEEVVVAKTKLTILNSMAGQQFESALDQHVAWGLTVLDLKDAIFGKGVVKLTHAEANRAADLIRARNLSVYCFSTGLFSGEIEAGEAEFRRRYLDKIEHVIEIAKPLQPQMIRLLAAQTSKRKELADSIGYIRENHPWLNPLYAQAIDRLHDAGFKVTIENEVGNCIFSNPKEILGFFAELNRREGVYLTWDVQNLWQMGTYPTMEVYHQLKGLIGYYHLKGGIGAMPASTLHWRSALEDASWPVVEITRQVVADGVSPVICLNPSHGKVKEGYDYQNIVKRDLDFIRREIPEIE